MKPSVLSRAGDGGATRQRHAAGKRSLKRDRKAEGWPPQVALDVLLTRTLSFLLDAGLPRKRLAEELREGADRIEAGGAVRKHQSANYQMMVQVSGLVHDWCWGSACTDATTGAPRALWLDEGNCTLRELIAERFPHKKPEVVLSWMQENGVIARQLDGSFALTRHSVLIRDSQALEMERIATLATQYLETGLYNLRTRDESCRNLDRTARVFDLPGKYVPQFRQMVQEQTQAFLETIDNWLESRNAPNSGEAGVEAGVHSYAYTSAHKSVGRRGKLRGSRRKEGL